VTQEDYQKVMGTNPALYKKPGHPVENVTWYEALLYCNERSKRDNLDTVYSYSEVNDMGMMDLAIDTSKSGYRLPTEAEWEYTCKANSTTNFYWGDTINNEYCHYEGTKDENSTITIVVASKRPNAFGIYDMSGNVWEYVNDMMQTYKSENRTNPLVWTSSASLVVVRGGSHEDKEDKLQSGYREGVIPFYKDGAPIYGFRVVLPKREPVRIETRRTKLPVDNNCASLKIFTIRGQYIGTINPTRFHKNKSRANGLYIGKYKATHKKLIDIIY